MDLTVSSHSDPMNMEFHSIAFHGTHFTQRQGEMSKLISFLKNAKINLAHIIPKQLITFPTAFYFFIFMSFAF